MSINKLDKRNSYTIIDNRLLQDKNLSLKAKGLLCVVMGLRDDWKFSLNGLASICKEGVGAVGTAMDELEDNGYLVRNKDRIYGKYNTEYDFFEIPVDEYFPD